MDDEKQRLARIRTLLGGAESVVREAQALGEEVGSLSRWIPRLFKRILDDIGDLAEEIDAVGGFIGELERAGEEAGVALGTPGEDQHHVDVIGERMREEAERSKEAFAAVAGEQYSPATQEPASVEREEAPPRHQ